MDRYPWKSVLRWDKSYPVPSQESKASLLSWLRSVDLLYKQSTAICEVYPDEISTNMKVCVLSLDLAACFADVNSKLELVIDSVDCRKRKRK